MAFSIMSLSEAVSRSRYYGYNDNVAPYEFATDDINECSAEMDYVLTSESVTMAELFAVTEEIMAEAAVTSPRSLGVITENVFTKIKDGLKKFFDKIIAMVKGIIDKLKAFFYKMTGKTSKWLEVMKPRIEAVKSNQTGWEQVKAETYPYDQTYIYTTMNQAVAKLADQWNGSDNPMTKMYEGVKAWIKDVAAKGSEYERPTDGEDKKPGAVKEDDPQLKELVKDTKDTLKDLEDDKKKFPKDVASIIGVSANSSMDAIWAECSKKARGGKAEKVSVTIGSNVDKMITALEQQSDKVSDLKDAYEKHLKDLVEFKSNLDQDDIKLDENDKIPGNLRSAIQDNANAAFKYISEMTSLVESAMNKARSVNLALIQEMASSYMSALTTFASYKAPKKS